MNFYNFYNLIESKIFPEEPKSLYNPENKQEMIRVERHNKYANDVDGGDIFFFDNWEHAQKWMNNDYYMFAAGADMAQNMTPQKRIEFNIEHGVFYKAFRELGSAEAHNEFGY